MRYNYSLVCGVVVAGCSQAVDPRFEPSPVVDSGVVRFIALGDGGEGNEAQYTNAEAIASVCAERSCDFALYLGDNIYDSGVDSVDDEQFQEKFELPFQGLEFPFYVVMGNHDYGGNGIGNEPEKVNLEVAYSEKSDKWTMPAAFYSFTQQHVGFLGLDTNAILWSWEDQQAEWLSYQLPQLRTRWKIAFGHHPYLSNGRHGNAGMYEGIPDFPVLSGQEFKDFFDDHLCHEIDLYLSGHDHTLQWLHPSCGVEFIVTGAAAKTTSLVGWGTPTFFETDESEGFVWIEVSDDQLTGVFYDKEGNLLYEQSLTKD